MNLRQVRTLYVHEVRSALRERSIVAMSIIVPLVMYPGILWAGIAGMTFIQGQAERATMRVAIQDLPAAHAALADSLRQDGRIVLSEWTAGRDAAQAEVARGRLDALIDFEPPAVGAGLSENVDVVISYSEARERSRGARGRVEAVLGSYRDAWIEDARRELQIDDAAWADFAVVRVDATTPDDEIRYILALLVPVLTLIMVALSAFYPAIDATAGERERSTWETLMTVAAPRGNIAAAKYLYVATFGALGGVLNLSALALSLRWILRPLGDGGGDELARGGIPIATLPIIAIGVALLGLLIAAAMLAFAVFARNFKEGQSMITPVYVMVLLPAFFLQSPDIELTPALALVPVANVALLMREALLGTVPLLQGSLTLASMLISVALAITFAQWVMRREEVLLGSQEGGLATFLRRRFRTRRSRA
jgi:sodium transport system permease protein